MRQSAVSFEADGLTFEGVVAQPDEGTGPWPGVVICHPHPLHGGNMDNNVVLALALGLAQEGFVTLRFNFRGVGFSEGTWRNGVGQTDDTATAVRAAGIAFPDLRLGIAGWSFGATTSLHWQIETGSTLPWVGVAPGSVAARACRGCNSARPKGPGSRSPVPGRGGLPRKATLSTGEGKLG